MCWHKWDKWKEYESHYTYTPGILSPGYIQGRTFNGVDYRQKRICLKCGKIQDKLIREL